MRNKEIRKFCHKFNSDKIDHFGNMKHIWGCSGDWCHDCPDGINIYKDQLRKKKRRILE